WKDPQFESFRQNTDDRVLAVIELESLSVYLRVGLVTGLPEFMTKDNHLVTTKLILSWQECASQCCLHSEQIEIISGNPRACDVLGLPFSSEVETLKGISDGHVFKDVIAISPGNEIER